MESLEQLNRLISERLNGDRGRIAELFQDEAVFVQMRDLARESDWVHFSPKTYDGYYLVNECSGYLVYFQERGSKSGFRVFNSLAEAATYFFNGLNNL